LIRWFRHAVFDQPVGGEFKELGENLSLSQAPQ
jgi:hypothetical protein